VYVASTRASAAGGGSASGSGRVPAAVFALGAVSLLTDVSAEMVTAFLPIYLLTTLGLGFVQFGLLDGLYHASTAVLRLVGGHIADRVQRPKMVALAGYGLSAVTKLAFPVGGTSAIGVGALLAADRAGKGLRTAPRDALISFSAPSDTWGRAFGVHRAMDTTGAMLGPLLTFAILATLGSAPGPVFAVSFCFALLGVVVLACFVPERSGTQWSGAQPAATPAVATVRRAVSVRDATALLRRRPLRRVTLAAAVLGAVTLSDAFVFVLLQRSTGVPLGMLPLLPVGTAVVFLLAAAPLGRLADRIGRWPVFVAGHLLLLGVYLLLLVPAGGYALIAAALVLHGLFYAATDGVLAACGAGLAPAELRATGLAVVQTGQALARLVSSVAFGFLLHSLAMGTAVGIAVAGLVAALAAALLLAHRVVPA
jgi:MFS family permease